MDVVKGTLPKKDERIAVQKEVVLGNSKWLSNSLIREVKWEGAIPLVRDFCVACGLEEAKIMRLGGTLDIFRRFGVVWPVLEDFDSGVRDLFLSLKPLFGNKGLPPRNVWLRSYGAPCMV